MESPVESGGLRNTSVVILTLNTNEVYIIISLSTTTDTQVIYIDPTTGSLQHNRKPGHDLFNSEDEAINYITNGSHLNCKNTIYAKAILGYVVLGGTALLLVATNLTASIPYLPGGGCVYVITESKWIKILLLNPQPQGKGESKNIQELSEIEIDGKHYFCETRDITRPFPSRAGLQNPDEEFVWNGWFSVAFRRIGLHQHCVILLQGFAEYRTFGSSSQQDGIVAHIARRSRLHPGTRYLARGLNSCYSTGNEIECEQIVWVPIQAGQSQTAPFNTYIWRRGTIPMWWGSELKMTAAEASIYVSNNDPYKGSARYYQRLTKRYDTRTLALINPNQNQNKNKNNLVPIVCVNLLRNGEGKSESILVQHFEESLNHIRSTGQLPDTKFHLIHYDWHTSNRLKGEQQTIEGLWYHLKAPTISIGISEGDYLPTRENMENYQGEIFYSDDIIGFFCIKAHQNGVIRYNCADSLDRTNAASFFGSIQVFTEQCRRVGIFLDNELTSEKSNDKDKAWKRFDMTFDELKKSTFLSPIFQLADLFLIAGDIHATLYTGSKAMHSHILSIFSAEAAKAKQFSVAQNVKINLQRRYNNAVTDSYRHKQLEMFLGLRLFKHLPSVPTQPLYVLSRPFGCLLKPVAIIDESSDDGDYLLSFKQKDLIWVSQQEADIIQLFIYLREPCHVCQLLLTISHGTDDSTYPSTVDVRTGRDLDALKVVLEGFSIPRCPNGTNMVIPIPGPVTDEDVGLKGTRANLHDFENKIPFLYDFKALEGKLDFLTRVVVLTFYPADSASSPVTLGEVEILGICLPWRDILSSEGLKDNSNYFPSKTNSNPGFVSSTNEVLPPGESNTSANTQVDLLTGDNMISGFNSQPMAGINMHDQSLNLNHGHNDDNTSQKVSVKDETEIKTGAEQYISCFEKLTALRGDNKLGFVESMKLEIERLRIDLSASERDKALSSIEIDPNTINPNTLIEESYINSLCKTANNLAVLGQTSLEDRINGLIGLDPIENNNDDDIDFWNISRIGEGCIGESCQIHAESLTLNLISKSKSTYFCYVCKRKACKVCCAGKGAILLRNNTGGSSYNNDIDGVICKKCCDDGVLDALVLDYIRVLISQRRNNHAQIATFKALNRVFGNKINNNIYGEHELFDNYGDVNGIQELLNGEESLAEFPFGSFLHSIESAPGSAPALSLLTPLKRNSGLTESYWRAPNTTSSTEVIIVLGNLSDVSGVILLVSPCGYSMSDSPTVQIWANNKIHKEEKSCVGKWEVRPLLTSSPNLFGPEESSKDGQSQSQTPRHIRFDFRNPVRCRLIWIKLTIQKLVSSSVSFGKDDNLLSLDDDPSCGPTRRASIGGSSENGPCIHAKRILVVGCTVKEDTEGLTSRKAEHLSSLKNWLEKPPLLNRYKVPIESEKLINNDMVLEQNISPASPVVAGFRVDGFTVIKPQLTHSPYSDQNSFQHNFLSPAVLSIQVSEIQGSSEEMVVVAEYRIPEVKGGTPMYFDFPKVMSSRKIYFRLTGDVTGFSDDPEDGGDSGRPLAAGLSLLNRIKLYYYANPSDIGRWSSLSGI